MSHKRSVPRPQRFRLSSAPVCVCFQALKDLCLDSKRSKILQKLELSLDILAGTVERISNTAEVLGAVHQVQRRHDSGYVRTQRERFSTLNHYNI